MTTVEYCFTPHPLGLAAGVPIQTWQVQYRWHWVACLMAYMNAGPIGRGAIGYTTGRVVDA